MASRSKAPGARHPRSPLPRQQTLREKLKNVQRTPMPAIPVPRPPAANGAPVPTPAAHSCRVFPFTRGSQRVQ